MKPIISKYLPKQSIFELITLACNRFYVHMGQPLSTDSSSPSHTILCNLPVNPFLSKDFIPCLYCSNHWLELTQLFLEY